MIRPADLARTVMIGNSGAGKTHLAARLGGGFGLPVHALDGIFWQPGGFEKPRGPEATAELLLGIIGGERWIAEGVYGGLAARAMTRATALLWLDLPVGECVQNLAWRGEADNAVLLDWAAAYPMREGATSLQGHQELFRAFGGPKARLLTRRESDALLAAG